MNEPTRLDFALAWFRYQRQRVRYWWRLSTGRCPACDKTRRGPHRFKCNKPGRLPSMRQIRKGD